MCALLKARQTLACGFTSKPRCLRRRTHEKAGIMLRHNGGLWPVVVVDPAVTFKMFLFFYTITLIKYVDIAVFYLRNVNIVRGPEWTDV